MFRDSETAYSDLVRVDTAAGPAAITVRDGPFGTRDLSRGVALGRVVCGLAPNRGLGSLGTEYPEVTGPGVKVEVQYLSSE